MTALAQGRIKRIHVNQHIIKSNHKGRTNEPPLTVKTSDGNIRARTVDIEGPSTVVYAADRPLACGARVWIETTAAVKTWE